MQGAHRRTNPVALSHRGFTPSSFSAATVHNGFIVRNQQRLIEPHRVVVPVFTPQIGPEEFAGVLDRFGGPTAASDFAALMTRMAPLSAAAQVKRGSPSPLCDPSGSMRQHNQRTAPFLPTCPDGGARHTLCRISVTSATEIFLDM
jgi:hypothetical protein